MDMSENVKRSMKDMVINNLIGGIVWGIGVTIGLSIVATLLTLTLKSINLVPIIGNFASEIISFVLQNNPHLVK